MCYFQIYLIRTRKLQVGSAECKKVGVKTVIHPF